MVFALTQHACAAVWKNRTDRGGRFVSSLCGIKSPVESRRVRRERGLTQNVLYVNGAGVIRYIYFG
jgi:hypothetical protein